MSAPLLVVYGGTPNFRNLDGVSQFLKNSGIEHWVSPERLPTIVRGQPRSLEMTPAGSAMVALRGVKQAAPDAVGLGTQCLVHKAMELDVALLCRAITRVAAKSDDAAQECGAGVRARLEQNPDVRYRVRQLENRCARDVLPVEQFCATPSGKGPNGQALALGVLLRAVVYEDGQMVEVESRRLVRAQVGEGGQIDVVEVTTRRDEVQGRRLGRAVLVRALRDLPWGPHLFSAIVTELACAHVITAQLVLDLVTPNGVSVCERARYFLGWTPALPRQVIRKKPQSKKKKQKNKKKSKKKNKNFAYPPWPAKLATKRLMVPERFPHVSPTGRANGALATLPACVRTNVDEYLIGGYASLCVLAGCSLGEWLWASGWAASGSTWRAVAVFNSRHIDGAFLKDAVTCASTRVLWTHKARKLVVGKEALGMFGGLAHFLMNAVDVRALREVESDAGYAVFLAGRVSVFPTYVQDWPNVEKLVVSGDDDGNAIRQDQLVKVINPDVIHWMNLRDGVALLTTRWVWGCSELAYLGWVREVLYVRRGDEEEEEDAYDIHPEWRLPMYIQCHRGGGDEQVTWADAVAARASTPALKELSAHPSVLHSGGLKLLYPLCGATETTLIVYGDPWGYDLPSDIDEDDLPLTVRSLVLYESCTAVLLRKLAPRVRVTATVDIDVGFESLLKPLSELLSGAIALGSGQVIVRGATARNLFHILNLPPDLDLNLLALHKKVSHNRARRVDIEVVGAVPLKDLACIVPAAKYLFLLAEHTVIHFSHVSSLAVRAMNVELKRKVSATVRDHVVLDNVSGASPREEFRLL